MKAWLVYSDDNESSGIFFADTAGKAKSQAIWDDEFSGNYDYTELYVKRDKIYDNMEKAPLIELWTLMWRNGYFYPDYESQYRTKPPDPDTSIDADFKEWAKGQFGSYLELSRP